MWPRLREKKEAPSTQPYSYFLDEVSTLKWKLCEAEYQRDRAQEALDTHTAVRGEKSDFTGYKERLGELVSTLQALADLAAVKADENTTIYRRAREQYEASIKALDLYLFTHSPDTPDFAEARLAGPDLSTLTEADS